MSSSFRVPPSPPSGDIDFIALSQVVWKQKKTIMLAAVITGLIAAGYAFLATPEYQISSVLRPAAINELDALNRSGIYQLPPSEALKRVGASLESYDTRLSFFRTNQPLFKKFERPGRTLEQSFEEFNRNSMSLALPDPQKENSLSAYIKIGMEYPEGVDGVTILNKLVEYAIALEREQVAADMDVIVRNRLNELKGKLIAARASYDADKGAKIALLAEADTLRRSQLNDELRALRNQLKAGRADRITQLNEAIGIARTLGIKKPSTPSSLGESGVGNASSVMRTEINNQQTPLYFLGTEALEAEREALVKRKSDDFTESRIAQIAKELQLLQSNRQIEVLNSRENEDLFLANVDSLRAEEARLRNLNIDMGKVKLVTIDKQALEPMSASKPKKALVIIVGILLGLMLGVVTVLVRSSVRGGKTFDPMDAGRDALPNKKKMVPVVVSHDV